MKGVNIKDIARLAGVGVSTVSRTINNHPDVSPETKQRIMEIIEKHKYIPNDNARHLKAGSSTSIAIIVKGMYNIFFLYMLEEMQKLISKRGYTIIVNYVTDKGDEINVALHLINERKPKGIIFLNADYNDFKLRFGKITVPCVAVTTSAAGLPYENLSSVSVDDVHGGYLAVDYLISKGHRKLAIVGGAYEKYATSGLRYDGVIKRLSEINMTLDDVVMIHSTFTAKEAYANTKSALEEGKQFTAVFAMSDIMAMGVAKAIVDCNLRIPEDISIIGYDGLELNKYYNPAITTLKQPIAEMTETAVELILEAVEIGVSPKHKISNLIIQEGESVKEILY